MHICTIIQDVHEHSRKYQNPASCMNMFMKYMLLDFGTYMSVFVNILGFSTYNERARDIRIPDKHAHAYMYQNPVCS
jgi:hypothetical protein